MAFFIIFLYNSRDYKRKGEEMELFVSDLDGTLLNKESKVSDNSRAIINDLISKGVQFTVATARTHATVVELLEGLNIEMPIAIMNGVAIYDLTHKKFLEIVDMSKDATKQALTIFNTLHLEPMIYGIKDDQLSVYYRALTNNVSQHFYSQRCDKPLKTFKQTNTFDKYIEDEKIVNMLVFDKIELIEEAYRQIKEIDGISATFYTTRVEGYGYMEMYSSDASKANGIKALAKYADFEKVIGFGDNLNDLPMFEMADEAYAPANAVDAIKAVATNVIGHHHEDGIALYLKERYESNQK